MSVDVQDGVLILPEEIYDCRSAVLASLSELQVSLHLNDYFMGE